MSDTADHSGLPEDELFAAEVALGVLAGPERSAAERRMAREPTFAALVAAWEERLSPWAAEIGEVAPPPQVWEKITAALPQERGRSASLWNSLVFLRVFAVASALAAACLAIVIYLGATRPGEPLVATIESGGQRSFVATVDTTRGTIAVVPAAFASDPARVPELWLIPPGGKPLPVGLLSAQKPVVIAIPAPLAGQAKSGATLAVSLEPPGGSPTGAPTGPVIGAGKLTAL
ncbi:MAG TPA: anti-sigma factor [Pseudolabrys sp.]